MSTPSHTPEPWHVYEGGNFVKIGAEGYDEYVEQEHYLGGPLCVADVEDDFHKREKLTEDHTKAMINAHRIVICVNACAGLSDPAVAIAKAVEALEACAPKCEHCGKIAVQKEPWTEGYYLCGEHSKGLVGDLYNPVQHPATIALAGLRSSTKEQSQRGSQREESK